MSLRCGRIKSGCKKYESFYIHTDAYTDVNVGMGIGILIPEAMILKSTIDKLASVDDKEILTVSDYPATRNTRLSIDLCQVDYVELHKFYRTLVTADPDVHTFYGSLVIGRLIMALRFYHKEVSTSSIKLERLTIFYHADNILFILLAPLNESSLKRANYGFIHGK
jgi:hypothetical protein